MSMAGMAFAYMPWFLSLLLAGAAIQDLLTLRISNLFALAIMLAFIPWVAWVGFQPGLWQNLALFVLTLAGGTVLFAWKVLGGGDVKLLAAIALWFDLPSGAMLVAYTFMAGGLVSLAFILLRRMMPRPADPAARRPTFKVRGPIPYGLAIAVGAISCIGTQGLHPDRRHGPATLHEIMASPIGDVSTGR